MLKFIAGRSGSGKSENIAQKIVQLTQGDKKVLLFVPEQYTFEMEKKYYEILGKSYKNLQVTSFTRYAYHTFKEYGGISGDYADESIKLILMSLAIDQVKSELKSYDKAIKNINFSKEMLTIVEELKHDDCSCAEFEKHSKLITEDKLLLREKTQDISLIYTTYEALLQRNYKDSLDDLTKLGQKVIENECLKDTYIFIDEFKAFTGRELEFIKIMLSQSQEVTVSLCLSKEKDELFDHTKETYSRLKNIAKQINQKVCVPEYLEEIYRFENGELKHLEKNVLRSIIKKYDEENNNIKAIVAKNEYEESEYVASTISNLVREENYNYKDMVIVTRDLESYKSSLEVAFSNYDIPLYLDERKLITQNPLMRFINIALNTTQTGINTESILALLKCRVMNVSTTDIAKLENYSYIWSFKRKDWENDFTLNINGKSENTKDSEIEELAKLNLIRKTLVDAIKKLNKALQSENIEKMAKAVAVFLEETGVREKIEDKVVSLNKGNADEKVIADEYIFVWNTIENILKIMLQVISEQKIDKKKFIDIFNLVSSNYDMGVIPQSLDCVIAGDAQRIRTNEPKVLFVMGVNDKVFPYVPTNNGVYTQNERKNLTEMFGILKSGDLTDKIKEEKFIAYKTLTIPTQKLYITSKKLNVKGDDQMRSYLYNQFTKMFGDIIIDTEDLPLDYFCTNKNTGFSILSDNFNQDNEYVASLKEYYSLDSDYKNRLESLFSVYNKKEHHIKDLDLINKIFTTNPTISPSKVESFNKCKFKYFCEYGLKIKERQKIELNAINIGNIVHEVLEHILRYFEDYIDLEQEKREEKVREKVLEIFEEKVKILGGNEFITSRVKYLYKNLMATTIIVVNRVLDEVKSSGFKPEDVECTIGKNGEIAGYTIHKGDITITLEGKVDRIDKFIDKDMQEYIRVIDYKTGKKDFRLSDIYNGENLQMYIYLKALLNSDKYKNCKPAGVLYMKATNLPIKETYEEGSLIEQLCNETYKFIGTVLHKTSVIKAIEPALDGKFADIKIKGKLENEDDPIDKRSLNVTKASTKNIVTELELQYLFDLVDKKIEEMVDDIYSGNITAKPFGKPNLLPCNYCYLKNRCGYEQGDEFREYENLSREDLFKDLENEEKEEK